MPRRPRQAPGGIVYHVLNRAVARLPLFEKPTDFEAFLRVLAETLEKFPMRILSFVLMPNHWHFVLWPEHDGELSTFCRRLTNTHSMRWHAHYHTSETGHIYQGRFKSFPVESDDPLYTLCRYVELNPLRAKLIPRTEQWQWSSLWRRIHGDDVPRSFLSPWPVPLPDDWVQRIPGTPYLFPKNGYGVTRIPPVCLADACYAKARSSNSKKNPGRPVDVHAWQGFAGSGELADQPGIA